MSDNGMESVSELELAVAKSDAGVLKRLRFVLKIMKAISAQPNSRNRQAPAYITELFDAIADWSGRENEDISNMLDQQIFPQVCQFISTFSGAEFDSFQQFLIKYTLTRWTEASNFAVLSFISDLYGFIARFAPAPIVDEYVELFMNKEMPLHVSVIILPAVLRNLANQQKHRISISSPEMSLLQMRKGENFTKELKDQLVGFWSSLDSTVLNKCLTSTFILQQCICSSCHLETLPVFDLVKILENLNAVGMNADFCRSDAFLLVSTILLSSIHSKGMKTNQPLSLPTRNLIGRITVNANKCRDVQINVFAMRVLQKVLENAPVEEKRIIDKLEETFNVNTSAPMDMDAGMRDEDEDESNFDTTLLAIENHVENFLSEGYSIDAGRRKRIKLVVTNLQKLC